MVTVDFAIDNEDTSVLSRDEGTGLTFLEQLTAQSSESCSKKNVPYFYRYDETTKRAEFVKGACRMWSCPSCGARNAKKWIARIIDGCNKLDSRWYFCTITAHKKWRGADASLKNIRANWHKVRKRYARIAKKEHKAFFYARVWEAHKDGSFHLHFITNIHQTKKQLKDMSAACGLGFMAHTDKVKNAGQVAGYVAKYMLKSMPNATQYPKGARRIEVSENWVDWKEKETDWQVALDVFAAEIVAQSLKKRGFIVHDLPVRNEMKKINEEIRKNVKASTSQENKRGNKNDSVSHAHSRTGEFDAEIRREQKSTQGQGERKPTDKRTERKPQSRYSDLFKRIKQSTVKDERILNRENRIKANTGSHLRN